MRVLHLLLIITLISYVCAITNPQICDDVANYIILHMRNGDIHYGPTDLPIYMNKACNALYSDPTNDEACDAFMTKYQTQMIKLMLNGHPPAHVCGYLNF